MELAGINIRNLANGIHILQHLKRYKKSQFYSREELLDVQTIQLKHILWNAVNNVPYYRSLKLSIDFENFSLNELQKFPIMSKQIMQQQYKNFSCCHVRFFLKLKLGCLYFDNFTLVGKCKFRIILLLFLN